MVRVRADTDPVLGRSSGLMGLLHPFTTEDFLRTAWETGPLLVGRNQPDYFEDLPGLDDVDELITSTTPGARAVGRGGNRSPWTDDGLVRTDRGRVSEREFRLTAAGVPDIQDVYRAYHDGYTIVLNALHRRSSAVANLARAVEAELHHPIGVNLYLTPRNAQGFDLHVDTHDVFIVQLHGTKEWHVAESAGSKPLPTESNTRPPQDTVLRAMTVKRGDTLYIPRGHAHRAVSTSTSSLHLTVGVHAFCWMDLMTEAVRLAAEADTELRRALPLGFLDREVDPARLAGLGDRLGRALTDESLIRRAQENLSASLVNGGKAAPGGHFRSLDHIAHLTEKSIVRWTRTMYHRIRKGPSDIAIEFDGNFVSGPLFLEDALRFVANHELFQIGQLPTFGDFPATAKTDLVSRLIREGLLAVVDHTPEGNSHAT